ncbi:hypothetical protein Tco_0681702 [Tanacetum coccineum]|uniref:Uncharacterized protein n=1 Tax=Tanacetum coccineum TaxID=301880 RepID=A0ABQ4XP30_9ASTR
MLDLYCSSSLSKIIFYVYGMKNVILHTENSFLSLLSLKKAGYAVLGYANTVYWVIFMDTAYGRRWIRRIKNCEYAFSCEDLALIRRISFPGYDVLVPSYKPTKRYKPVEKISIAKEPKRQIPIGHGFSNTKTTNVHEKTMTPRSCLRWKPTGRIFNTTGLRWVPTGKIFTSSTTKVDSEPTNGLNTDITNQYECQQTLDVSAGTLNLNSGTYFNPKKEGLEVWLLKRLISQKPGIQGILI